MKRRAFTLLELLLVLALICVIAGMGVAGYQRMYERSRFKSGVIGVQIDLNRTRLLAMRTGQAYFFRFIPGTGIYEIAPLPTLQEAIYRMNDAEFADFPNALGGSLATNGYEFATSTAGGYYDGFDPMGTASSELASDDLFSRENIQADMERAGYGASSATSPFANVELGGTLDSGGASATSGGPIGGGLSGSAFADPFASMSFDALGTGDEFALGTTAPFLDSAGNQGITIRDMNADERPLGKTDNTIAWRVNADGLVVRKEAEGDVIFTFSRLSDSTPTNLKQRRPGSADTAQDAQGAWADQPGEDMGSRLGGSLRSPPEASGAQGLGGGLSTPTNDLDLYANALIAGEQEIGPRSLWSDPILFYPNGRTSTVVLSLAGLGKIHYYSEIGVRGMTGYARISSITKTPSNTRPGASALTQEQFFRMTQPGVPYQYEDASTLATGGALGGATAPEAAPSLQDSSFGDATANVGIDDFASQNDLINQGMTPDYGASQRRSGYNVTGGDVTENAGIDDFASQNNLINQGSTTNYGSTQPRSGYNFFGGGAATAPERFEAPIGQTPAQDAFESGGPTLGTPGLAPGPSDERGDNFAATGGAM
ncbi:MAG: prepilin-type N-terminal cleavage/methylation domain-containing protein [Thermoguttaceae bacterium]|jgi:prepilin-type N-terminal cleavage/methylation domain-containing protein